jgi:hypothetical protein
MEYARRLISAALAVTLACLASIAIAPPIAAAEITRLALVIGNSAYPAAPVRTAVADARALADRLERAGFAVTILLDAEKRDMETAIAGFADALAASDVALVFYAGHGIQVNGRNYLVPVDARLAGETRLRLEAIELDALFDAMREPRRGARLVILDACHRAARPELLANRGCLGPSTTPPETLVVYAAAQDKPAGEPKGTMGLVAAELMAALDRPGIGAEEAMKSLRAGVARRSGGTQVPWQLSTLTQDAVLLEPAAVPSTPDATLVPRPPLPETAIRASEPERSAKREATGSGRFDGRWRAVGSIGPCLMTLTATVSGGRMVGEIEQVGQKGHFDGPIADDDRFHAEFDAPISGRGANLHTPATLDGTFPELELTMAERCGGSIRFRLVEAATDPVDGAWVPANTPTNNR